MKVFNEVRYIASKHAKEQIEDRFPGTPRKYAGSIAESMAYDGQLIIEHGKYRYLKFEQFFLPCTKMPNKVFIINTVITPELMQREYGSIVNRIEKYLNKY